MLVLRIEWLLHKAVRCSHDIWSKAIKLRRVSRFLSAEKLASSPEVKGATYSFNPKAFTIVSANPLTFFTVELLRLGQLSVPGPVSDRTRSPGQLARPVGLQESLHILKFFVAILLETPLHELEAVQSPVHLPAQSLSLAL